MSVLDQIIGDKNKEMQSIGFDRAKLIADTSKETMDYISKAGEGQRAQNRQDEVERQYTEPDRTTSLVNEIAALEGIGGMGDTYLGKQYKDWAKEYQGAVNKGDQGRVDQLKAYRQNSLMADRELAAIRDRAMGIKRGGGGRGPNDDQYLPITKRIGEVYAQNLTGAVGKSLGFNNPETGAIAQTLFQRIAGSPRQRDNDGAAGAERYATGVYSGLTDVRKSPDKVLKVFDAAANLATQDALRGVKNPDQATIDTIYATKFEELQKNPKMFAQYYSAALEDSAFSSSGSDADPAARGDVRVHIKSILEGELKNKEYLNSVSKVFEDMKKSGYARSAVRSWRNEPQPLKAAYSIYFKNGRPNPDLLSDANTRAEIAGLFKGAGINDNGKAIDVSRLGDKNYVVTILDENGNPSMQTNGEALLAQMKSTEPLAPAGQALKSISQKFSSVKGMYNGKPAIFERDGDGIVVLESGMENGIQFSRKVKVPIGDVPVNVRTRLGLQ